MVQLLYKLYIRWSHFWNGCARFNLRHPHWKKDSVGDFPRCTICGLSGYWIWGYKQHQPDYYAQSIQGGKPPEDARYWTVHDGWRKY